MSTNSSRWAVHSLAADLNAVSADHVVVTPDADIAALGRSDTIAVSLPPTPFGLAHTHYTPAQKFLDAGAALAIATDCNPGTGWNENMQFVMALAARYLRLTPAQALAAATINAAYAIGRGERVGSLEPGKQADLVIWDAPAYPHLSYRFGSNLATDRDQARASGLSRLAVPDLEPDRDIGDQLVIDVISSV